MAFVKENLRPFEDSEGLRALKCSTEGKVEVMDNNGFLSTLRGMPCAHLAACTAAGKDRYSFVHPAFKRESRKRDGHCGCHHNASRHVPNDGYSIQTNLSSSRYATRHTMMAVHCQGVLRGEWGSF